jgi:hypothetical protein
MRLIACLSFFSLIFLAGCDDFPTIQPQERCVTILDTENVQEINDILYYTGVCQCQLYQWSAEGIGKIGTPTTRPLNYCDKFAGFSPKSTGAIYSWQEAIRLWLLRHETKK